MAGVPLKRIRLVHPRAGRCALLEGIKQAGEGCVVLPPRIFDEEDGQPIKELRHIYRGERMV
jgi:tRNA1(Val) A37 N6-methylase TrmN6